MVLIAVVALLRAPAAYPHGGVVMEEDVCLINIGPMRAHFTVYQPQTQGSEEFCEDIPDLGEALFVMEYLHDTLRQVPLEFRIVRDVNNRTKYASWDDIRAMDDLEAATVYYQSPRVHPGGSMRLAHEFREKGWYIGVVSTRHPTLERTYNAVFGFHVGGRGLGYWPLFLLLAVLVQGHFWLSNRGWRPFRPRASEPERQDEEP